MGYIYDKRDVADFFTAIAKARGLYLFEFLNFDYEYEPYTYIGKFSNQSNGYGKTVNFNLDCSRLTPDELIDIEKSLIEYF